MSDLAEIHRIVGQIEGKVDSLIERHDARDRTDEKRDARLRTVENRQHWYSGAGAIVGVLLGYFGVHIKI
jgi:hypothetical protein